MMSLAVPPGCGFEIFALGCGARGAACAGAVPAVAGCSDWRVGTLLVLAGGLGYATSGFGGFGADPTPHASCPAIASPIARGGHAPRAAAAVAGASCIRVA